MSKRVLIVGGVAGGASCAARLRRLDETVEIVLFERGPYVSFANCGLPYRVGNVIQERDKLLVATPDLFRQRFRIDVRIRQEVTAIDRDAREVTVLDHQTGESHRDRYDVLVLAPGAAPIRPPLVGIDLPGIFTLRNIPDMDAIRAWIDDRNAQRAVVIGGGFIGLEMVENLAHRGISVTLLEKLPQVMPPMDAEMVTSVHAHLREHGVDLRLSEGVEAFETGTDAPLVVLSETGGRYAADLAVLAIGVRPDVQLARDAGLALGPCGGIRVDDRMRTSDPCILAVGDAVEVTDVVTGQPALVPLAGPANRQGRIAADVICGRASRFRGVQGTAVVGVFELTVAATGASEKALRRAGMACEKVYIHAGHHAGYYPGAEHLVLKVLFDPESGKILGAQGVGKAGVDKRIDVLATMIQLGGTVYDLEEAELAYAPQYGSAKDPVNMAGFVAANHLRGDSPLVHWADWHAAAERGDGPLVLDVRTQQERETGAVPGSVHIPLDELRERLDDLPRDREIWAHCGIGQRSYYAVRILVQNGFTVRNLAGGWRGHQQVLGTFGGP